MAHHSTILAQVLKIVPRHEIASLTKAHHQGRDTPKINRWDQFVSLTTAQLTGRTSLRDVVSNLAAQAKKLYHIGSRAVSRSSLARFNEKQPYDFYRDLFNKLLPRCQTMAPKHKFRFKNKLYSMDGSLIDLSLSIFPWAKFNKSRGAIKLHLGLDHSGYLPAFATITEGKASELTWAKTLSFPKGSILVFDRGYKSYEWLYSLHQREIFFVTRLPKNTRLEVLHEYELPERRGLMNDQLVKLTGESASKCPAHLRRVVYWDAETNKRYVFFTNNFKLAAKTIANIYKERWQIELFFKWIKQNLKVKAFLGTSKNAVLTQVWAALCTCLILAYLRFLSRTGLSMQQVLRLLQLNLFERRDLMPLITGSPPLLPNQNHNQLVLL